MPHLSDQKAVAKMGVPTFVVIREKYSGFFGYASE
jgi:hypothetical protein